LTSTKKKGLDKKDERDSTAEISDNTCISGGNSDFRRINMKQKNTQEQEGSRSSDKSGTDISKRPKLFLALCIIVICLIALTLLAFKLLFPSDLDTSFITEITSEQKAASFLKKEMLAIANRLIEEFPKDENLRMLAVEAYLACLNYTQAEALLEEGISLNPGHGEFYQSLARIARNQGQYDKAVTYWKRALEVSPKRSDLNIDIAEALMLLGRHKGAIEELEKRIKVQPESIRSYYLLGQVYLQLKEYDEARKYYEKVIEFRPNDPKANFGLATVYMRLKQRDKAEKHMAVYREWQAGLDIRRKARADSDKTGV